MTHDENARREQAEVVDRLTAILEARGRSQLAKTTESFAAARAIGTSPDFVARLMLDPIRTGRCAHLPARFWFIAAEVFYRADHDGECRAALGRAFDAATDDDVDRCAHGYFLLGLLEASQPDWAHAVAAWEKSLELLPPSSPMEPAVLVLLGEAWEALGQSDRASSRFVESLKLAASRGQLGTECAALYQLGRHALDRGWIDQALVYLDQAMERSRAEGYPAGESTSEIARGVAKRELGDLDGARELVKAGLAKARELDDRLLQASALEHVAEIERRAGDVEAARAALEEAIFLAGGADAHALLAALYHMLAMLHETSGRKTHAITAYENALRERRRAGDAAGLGATLNNLASLHLELGDSAAARRLYREAVMAFGECGHERLEIEVVLENIKKLDAGAGAEAAAEDDETGAPDGHEADATRLAAMDDSKEIAFRRRPLRPPIPFPGRPERRK